MAKTATDIPITQGSGVNLSNFALASGRRRQTVIVADADDAGEALLVELPAHDAADRGSSLKIGGRASAAVFADVNSADRTDAWFSLGGQLGAISTKEPATVYDGGRRAIVTTNSSGGLASTAFEVAPATAGMRNKVLSVNVICAAFTTAGSVYLRNGADSATLFWITRVTTVGQNYFFNLGGHIITQTTVNSALQIYFDGNANFGVSVIYYQAP